MAVLRLVGRFEVVKIINRITTRKDWTYRHLFSERLGKVTKLTALVHGCVTTTNPHQS